MTDKDLSRALLNLDSQQLAGVSDVRQQTAKIIQRDQSRVWWWTAGTFALWGLAIFMVMLMMVLYALVFPLQAKLAQQPGENPAAHREQERLDLDNLTPEQRKDAQFKAQIMFQMVTVGVTMSVGVTCLAVLASIMLSRASRRAVLLH